MLVFPLPDDPSTMTLCRTVNRLLSWCTLDTNVSVACACSTHSWQAQENIVDLWSNEPSVRNSHTGTCTDIVKFIRPFSLTCSPSSRHTA